MKTLLSQFCEEFDSALRPLLAPMIEAADTLNHLTTGPSSATGSAKGVKAVLPQVLDVRHHLGTLVDKVAAQQAYVLIFGPLKSGKSTLMNAISGAYVSEVSSLPAYPTMVYVDNSEQKNFTITRYNGETQEFSDMDSMRTLMEWAHNELADRLREVESRGEQFDPAEHIPQAIRRVDVRLPANHLAESSAVLVDTPGLYTRMKFGYDRLTKEFRNSAASAIFVVKTDNLFLEQVFDEFDSLLQMFSRIFLVVNVDSTKRDLFPDGELGPSLEGQHPDRIITAFENLAMTNPLRRAVDEGKLRIYPVDLLQAASMRMKGDDLTEGDVPVGVAGFHRFMTDLSDYLNSTDYLVAFLSDSLRQAWTLLDELKAVGDADAVKRLDGEIKSLEQRLAALGKRDAAIATLAKAGWNDFFGKLGEDLASIGGGRIEKLREQTGDQIAAALEAWFEGDGSFEDLLEDHMLPLLSATRDDLARTVGGVIETVAGTEHAGGHPDAAIKAALQALELSMGKVGLACVKGFDPVEGLAHARVRVTTATVPVKRGLLDYLFLRRLVTLQKRLFGPVDEPIKAVPRQAKLRRLGEPARAALQEALEHDFSEYLNGALDHITGQVVTHYVESLRKALRVELKGLRDRLLAEKSQVEVALGELRKVDGALGRMARAVSTTTAALSDLSGRYGEADPALLDKPVHDDEGFDRDGEDLELTDGLGALEEPGV